MRVCYQKLIIPEVIVANLPEKRTAAVWRSVPPIDGISGNFPSSTTSLIALAGLMGLIAAYGCAMW